jgi:hypothetical protein
VITERVEIDGRYDEVEYPRWWKMDTARGLFPSTSNCKEKHHVTAVQVELILCMTSYQTAVKLLTVWGVKRFFAFSILTAWILIGIVSLSSLLTL